MINNDTKSSPKVFPAATNQNGLIINSNCHMFSETKRVSTCPYQLTIFGLLMIGLLWTIDRVTSESVIVWTDYATLSPF